MQGREQDTAPTGRPELFWVLFVLVCGGLLLAVVVPAGRELDAARKRIRLANQRLESSRRTLDEMRRARQALERGDLEIWEAEARNRGMGRPGEVRFITPSPEDPQRSPER